MSDTENETASSTESDEQPQAEVTTPEVDSEGAQGESETFDRPYVESLRQESGKYRQRAQQAERRLHTELVRADGRLADPSDLEYNDEHLTEPDKLSTAIDELLETKPHLRSRKPVGDIGQGQRGSTAEPFDFAAVLRQRV